MAYKSDGSVTNDDRDKANNKRHAGRCLPPCPGLLLLRPVNNIHYSLWFHLVDDGHRTPPCPCHTRKGKRPTHARLPDAFGYVLTSVYILHCPVR